MDNKHMKLSRNNILLWRAKICKPSLHFNECILKTFYWPSYRAMYVFGIYSVTTNFCLELIEPSAREVFFIRLLSREKSRVGAELRGEEIKMVHQPETRNSVRTHKNCWPSISLSISSRRKLVDTLYIIFFCRKKSKYSVPLPAV